MSHETTINHQSSNHSDLAIFGFWIYILTDLIMFGSLFAVFSVLRYNTAQGVEAADIFNLNHVLFETILLLTSSFTFGIASIMAKAKRQSATLIYLGLTFLLGLAFIISEVNGFLELIHEGNGWQRSAFLSSYFTLVGTHGLHVTFGLGWLIFLSYLIIRHGMTKRIQTKLTIFGIFWHFLDIVWIFVFTIVYLIGAM